MNLARERAKAREKETGRGKGNKGERSIAHTVPRLKGFFFPPPCHSAILIFFFFIMILLHGLETFNNSSPQKYLIKISNIIKLCWTGLNKVSSWIVSRPSLAGNRLERIDSVARPLCGPDFDQSDFFFRL